MADPYKVLNCCRYHWERTKQIEKRYDELYPPQWYNWFRLFCMSENLPSVKLNYELGFLQEHGLVDFKIEGNEVFIAPDGTRVSCPIVWYKLKPGGQRVRRETQTSQEFQPA